MKNLIYCLSILVAFVIFSFITVGCNNNDDEEKSFDTITALINKEGVILYTSERVGFSRVYEMGNRNLLITDQTSLQKQRPSCSGFDYCGPRDIGPGNYIEFSYYLKDVNITVHPQDVIVTSVKAYRDECLLSPITSTDTNDPCGDCDPCVDCD
ncbi:MAG: hypothetical protein WC375_00235 [Methanomassiliicoccales archaeon]|jgi:hypothetical protein